MTINAPVVAVAGISGYTGLRMLPHLADDARLLLRPSTAKNSPWKDDARSVSVDLLDENALESALKGDGREKSRAAVDTIVCLVGTTRAQFRPATETEPAVSYETVDIGIPRALARAGKRASVRRFVLLSSFGIDSPGPYPAAKRAAESAVRESGLAWVIMRPSFIVGPGRKAQKALDVLWAPIGLFARGWKDDIRSIDVEVLSRALARIANAPEWGTDWDGRVLSGRQLQEIGA